MKIVIIIASLFIISCGGSSNIAPRNSVSTPTSAQPEYENRAGKNARRSPL